MVSWEIFGFSMEDNSITDDYNMDTNKNIITIDNRIIFFPDDSKAREYLSDYWWTCPGNILCNSSINVSHHLEDSSPILSEPADECQSREEFKCKSRLKSCQKSDQREKPSRRSKRKRSVSFVDDVMVFVFDQERPTMELQSDSCTNPCPSVQPEDCGLEWDDDFSAFEKSSHFQSVHQHRNRSPATENWNLISERLFLPQSCLYLTHVSESDLEP